MVCPECGQSVTYDARVCPQCGHVLRVSGLRVRHPSGGGELTTAKRDALTPTHPRLSQVAATALTPAATDPWQNEWMGTAKRPSSAATPPTSRRYLLPATIATVFLVACVGIALVLHGVLFSVYSSPLKPVSATMTSVPTATIVATNTSVPTATVAAYSPPRHAATATPTSVPTAMPTATAPIVIVTTTANPIATATDVATKGPEPTKTP